MEYYFLRPETTGSTATYAAFIDMKSAQAMEQSNLLASIVRVHFLTCFLSYIVENVDFIFEVYLNAVCFSLTYMFWLKIHFQFYRHYS